MDEDERIQKLLKMNKDIQSFLRNRRESYGGWAEITEQDMMDLRSIINLLIDLKCEKDSDGDLPIEYILINRVREYLPYFHPIQYDDDTPDQLFTVMEQKYFNLSLAQNDFDSTMRSWWYQRAIEKENKKSVL